MRQVGAWLLAVAIGIAGAVLMVLAGLVALLITDPIYPFWPVFLPLALLATGLIAWTMGRIPAWLYPSHPDRQRWSRLGQVVAALAMAGGGLGVYHLCTMQIHWQ